MSGKLKPFSKERFNIFLNALAKHVEKHRIIMIVCLSLIAAFGLTMSIYWEFDDNTAGLIEDYIYLAADIFYVVISLTMIAILVLNKYKKIPMGIVAIADHVFAFLMIAGATLLCVMDLKIGLSPYIYLIVCTAIAGLFIVEPRIFIFTVALSVVCIGVYTAVKPYAFFDDDFRIENAIYSIVYLAVVIFISIRHYSVTMREYKYAAELEKLTYYDNLTGLLNERSYSIELDKIADEEKSGNVEPYAVVMMDLNNLKYTNDLFGHHYGCYLIIRCGELLPTVFTYEKSKLFHVGGDEFIAIARGKDLENFDKTIQDLDEKLLYSEIEYEGQNLIFSVARGYAIYKNGQRYQEVLQKADSEMYTHKKHIKKEKNIQGR